MQKVQKTVEGPQIQYVEQFMDVSVTKRTEVLQIQKIQQTVTVPQIRTDDRFVDVPVQSAVKVPQVRCRPLSSRRRRSR